MINPGWIDLMVAKEMIGVTTLKQLNRMAGKPYLTTSRS